MPAKKALSLLAVLLSVILQFMVLNLGVMDYGIASLVLTKHKLN